MVQADPAEAVTGKTGVKSCRHPESVIVIGGSQIIKAKPGKNACCQIGHQVMSDIDSGLLQVGGWVSVGTDLSYQESGVPLPWR
jgi:hypothetical protein